MDHSSLYPRSLQPAAPRSARRWPRLGQALALACALWVAIPGASAAAEDWPKARPVTLIVGYPPGGGADTTARLLAEQLSKQLGQTFVVENRAGASGSIGVSTVKRAAPDGYTFLVAASSEMTIAPVVYKSLPYDPEKDLAPVALVGQWPYVLVAYPKFPPNTLKEMVAYLKAHPGKASFSSFGANTVTHLTGEMFKAQADVEALHVPYKGSGPSLTDLMSGQVQFTFDSPVATLKLVEAGKLKAIAVTSKTRLPGAKDIPTTAEAGYPDLLSSAWIGVLAPRDTPRAIIDKLNAAIRASLATPEMGKTLAERSIEAGGGTPEDLGERIHTELATWRSVADKIGLKAE